MIFGTAKGSKIIHIEKICNRKFGILKTKRIIDKTGPKKIYISNKNENTLTLSISAWKNLNKKYKINDIKKLFYVTETPVKLFPGNGFLFASKVKLNSKIHIMDFNSGCTGFVDALAMCLSYKKKSIIVCSETYSKNNLRFNRSTTTLFSDGATVFVPNLKKLKYIDSSFGYKPNSFDDLKCDLNSQLFMEGKNVFDFVSSIVFPEIKKILNKNKKKKINRIYLHQGSEHVVNFLKNKLKSYCDYIPSNIKKYGNFVSATLPMLISQDLKKNPIKKKENILLCGFGVGLAYSILILEIDKN